MHDRLDILHHLRILQPLGFLGKLFYFPPSLSAGNKVLSGGETAAETGGQTSAAYQRICVPLVTTTEQHTG